jgi:site-specific recombinase XerD
MENATILMYLKSRKNAKGESPIYLRVTVDGKRVEKSLNRSIDSNRWDKNKNRGKGTTEKIRILNQYLNSVEHEIYMAKQELINNNKRITIETLMNKYLGVDNKKYTLIEVIEFENGRIKELIEHSTYKKYITFLNHVKNYINHQYKTTDIDINDIDYEFVSNFDFYLRAKKNIGNNSAIRIVKMLQKVYKTTIDKGWTNKDPFTNYKKTKVVKDVVFLTKDEIDAIYNKDIDDEVLDKVRDAFVFSCYTALAYCDVQSLSENDIVTGLDSYRWLKIKRRKTKNVCDIPLLPVAEEIIEKYKNHPSVIVSGKLLPVMSNQKMNLYLKAVKNICGIKKNLHFHMARHSFGSSIAAANKLPIEAIMKIMGHKTIAQARHYAKISTAMILDDVAALRARLAEPKKDSRDGVMDYTKSEAV